MVPGGFMNILMFINYVIKRELDLEEIDLKKIYQQIIYLLNQNDYTIVIPISPIEVVKFFKSKILSLEQYNLENLASIMAAHGQTQD